MTHLLSDKKVSTMVISGFVPLPVIVDFLVIAGGGAGGYPRGGGGAGGYRCSVEGEASGGGASAEPTLSLYPGTPYTITVGAGGSAPLTQYEAGGSGSNSVFGTITSIGGGGGGGSYVESIPTNGGSGGGCGDYGGTAGAGTLNQGFAGGSKSGSTGGGGGGAGEVGSTDGVGQGGDGVQSSINGTQTYRGGGGGAGTSTSGASSAVGGEGGGGNGATRDNNNATAGAINTGGGGGGGSSGSSISNGKNGGSGIVIIKIPSTRTATFSEGVTYNLITSVTNYKIYEVTATSTTSETVTFY